MISIYFYDIAIDRELPTSTLNGVDVTANDVEIPTFRSTIDRRSENVDESMTGSAFD